MDLRKFPLDTQACPLEIGSFGFNVDEIKYTWTSTPLSMDDALELAQYQMITWHHGHKLVKMRNGVRSVIYLKFDFRRAIGFYVLQVDNTDMKVDNRHSYLQRCMFPCTLS